MRTLDDLGDLSGRRVLVRADFNVPLKAGADHVRLADVRPPATATTSVTWPGGGDA